MLSFTGQPLFSGQCAAAVTPSDSNALSDTLTRAVYVGGAGDLKVTMADGDTAVFKAVPVGTWLWIAVSQVFATGTTATNILAIY